MPKRYRLATFNVENLFSRAKLLNLDNHEEGDKRLKLLRQFQSELVRVDWNLFSRLCEAQSLPGRV